MRQNFSQKMWFFCFSKVNFSRGKQNIVNLQKDNNSILSRNKLFQIYSTTRWEWRSFNNVEKKLQIFICLNSTWVVHWVRFETKIIDFVFNQDVRLFDYVQNEVDIRPYWNYNNVDFDQVSIQDHIDYSILVFGVVDLWNYCSH
jgi:hypothetical protein